MKKCLSLLNKELQTINDNKKQMFPFSDTFIEIQETLEEMENCHDFMKDQLDSNFEQQTEGQMSRL